MGLAGYTSEVAARGRDHLIPLQRIEETGELIAQAAQHSPNRFVGQLAALFGIEDIPVVVLSEQGERLLIVAQRIGALLLVFGVV